MALQSPLHEVGRSREPLVNTLIRGSAGPSAAEVLTLCLHFLLPSKRLAPSATRRGARHRQSRAARAFSAVMVPLTLGVLLATGWVRLEPASGHPGSASLLVHTWPPSTLGALVGSFGGVG